jgi:hypothetical protein
MKKINSAAVAIFALFSLVTFQGAHAGNACVADTNASIAFETCTVDPEKVSLTLVQLHFCETFPNWESGFDNCTSAGIDAVELSLSAGDSVTLSSSTKPVSGSYKYVVEVYGTESGVQADIEWDKDFWIRSDDPTNPAKGGKYCWTMSDRDQCGPSMSVAEMKVATQTGFSANDHCPVMQFATNPQNGRFYCSNNIGDDAIDAVLNEADYVEGTYNGFLYTGIIAQGPLSSLSRSSTPGGETFKLGIYFKTTPIVISDTTNTITYDVKITGSAGGVYTAQNMYDPNDSSFSAWLFNNPNNEHVLNNIGNLGLNITITPN